MPLDRLIRRRNISNPIFLILHFRRANVFIQLPPICALKFLRLLPLPDVEPEVGTDIGMLLTVDFRPAPFREPREDVEVEGGAGEVDGLPAEGALGGLAADVLEALPADGVPVAADEGRQPPVSVVLIHADGALLGPSQNAAPFHFLLCCDLFLTTTGKTHTSI